MIIDYKLNLIGDDLSAQCDRNKFRSEMHCSNMLADVTIVIPTLNESLNIEPLVKRLDAALGGIAWEAIFVDDDSQDLTIDHIREVAQRDGRIRGLRRIGRRGLAGAALEGMLASSAPFIALIDADLQHDETKLAAMFAILQRGEADMVVASRYRPAGDAASGFSRLRGMSSRVANGMARSILKVEISDPMSGFFMTRREIVDRVAPGLSQQGFKLLLDIVTATTQSLRIVEIPYAFSPRQHGESKLDGRVMLEFAGLLAAKWSSGLMTQRMLAFGLVGMSGLIVHLAILAALLNGGLRFTVAQAAAMSVAMASNYLLNNAVTFGDRRRRGWRLFSGFAMFSGLCSFGLLAGVGLSSLFYQSEPEWWAAGLAGAAVGAVWNYVTNTTITWRAR